MENNDKVKIEIEVTGSSIEVVNVILSAAYDALSEEKKLADAFGLDARDVVSIESFRQQLLMGYFEYCKTNKLEEKQQ